MNIEVIGKKTSLDQSYIAEFNQQKIGLYARSLAGARQKAFEYFKPKKTEMDSFSVGLYGGKFNVKKAK